MAKNNKVVLNMNSRVQYIKTRKRESKGKKYSATMVRVVPKESIARQAASAYQILSVEIEKIERAEAENWEKARTRTFG